MSGRCQRPSLGCMCNHYRQAILKGETIPGWSSDAFSEFRIPLRFSNLPEHVYPDRPAVVLRRIGAGLDASSMRWGFPKVDAPGASWVTNARHVVGRRGEPAAYWAPWTGLEHRCLVPATSFFEPDQRTVGTGAFREAEFARADGLPFMFAGLWRPWTGLRGTKKEPAQGDHELFTILTTQPNNVVKPVHHKAMPVMLLTPEACETWLGAPIGTAIRLQAPPEDALVRVIPHTQA